MALAEIFRPEVAKAPLRRGAPIPRGIPGRRRADGTATADASLAALAAARLNAARAELDAARSASMSASLACQAAQGRKSVAERHSLKLAHRTATERLELAQASVDKCQREFDAAFRSFQGA